MSLRGRNARGLGRNARVMRETRVARCVKRLLPVYHRIVSNTASSLPSFVDCDVEALCPKSCVGLIWLCTRVYTTSNDEAGYDVDIGDRYLLFGVYQTPRAK